MNFVTYLVARFAISPVGEGILGGLGLILIVALLPLFLILAPFGWVWMVYDEWREFKDQDV